MIRDAAFAIVIAIYAALGAELARRLWESLL
jgi:hypothetical protein